jgi:hypothetical protein
MLKKICLLSIVAVAAVLWSGANILVANLNSGTLGKR